MQTLSVNLLKPHPDNPRIAPHQDVVDQIAAQLNGAMDEAYALIVRPNGEGYQILSGHHRWLAAQQAGLTEVPCHVREMDDADAYMALALNNSQRELHPLEVGRHALKSGLSVREYAKLVGVPQRTLADRVCAARVVSGYPLTQVDQQQWQQLVAIHAAPRWLWSALVAAMPATVEKTRDVVKRLKNAQEPPAWSDAEAIAAAVVSGQAKPQIGQTLATDVTAARNTLQKNSLDVDRFVADLDNALDDARPSKPSEVADIINKVLGAQEALIKEQRESAAKQARAVEQRAERLAHLRKYCSLTEWKSLDADEQTEVLAFSGPSAPTFNKQTSADIEWAQWSWNPVTGCLHDCPYCYARDIAQQDRMAPFYPNGFLPTLRPAHLSAPQSQKIPKEARTDARFKNVFTCSMADLFGRWVPKEWINAVLAQMHAAPQWNFLCLTKFPKRMAEFKIPANTWMGTTVDVQARVRAAEKAFEKVNAAVKWLSVEPMLEPLKFSRLELFDWIVIGGASRSTKTPAWYPPVEWVINLVNDARAANVAVYMKTNLFDKSTPRVLELPTNLPVQQDDAQLAEPFLYLGSKSKDDVILGENV